MSEFDRDLKHLESLLDPALPKAKNRGETTITIRLPMALKHSLKAEAEARGLNFSDYLRSKLSDETAPVLRRPQLQITSIDRGLLIELSRIGTNLNQAVRRLNSQPQPKITPVDRQLLLTLLETVRKIKTALTSKVHELEEE